MKTSYRQPAKKDSTPRPSKPSVVYAEPEPTSYMKPEVVYSEPTYNAPKPTATGYSNYNAPPKSAYSKPKPTESAYKPPKPTEAAYKPKPTTSYQPSPLCCALVSDMLPVTN